MTYEPSGQLTSEAADYYEKHFVPALFKERTGALLDCAKVSARDSVLDVGCGTGVLSVVAALRGADHVRAIDVADAAVAATADNARRNGISEAVTADAAPAESLDGTYDIVLANILAPELIALAPHLRSLTASDGSLVISGILAGAHGHVLDALRPMVVERTEVLDGWAAVTLRHPAPRPT